MGPINADALRADAGRKLAAAAGIGLVYGALWLARFPCVFLWLTGKPCPGCGISRALWSVLRGRWGEALRWNPMVFSLPLLAGEIWCGGALFRGKTANRLVLAAILAGFVTCYVMRLCGVWLTRI